MKSFWYGAKWVIGMLLVGALELGLICAALAGTVPEQTAVTVWDAGCIYSVDRTPHTRIVAPNKDDGSPDLSKALIEGLTVTFVENCGHLEVRSTPPQK